ncbi:PAS domain S-box protein [Tunturiibacter gelidoferens]|jgi:two-component system, OmpR family, sensor histidine kinase VicK|uniref:histidine kinase n=1 Tax=Tunturiibacter gelidiferens TaxID=3069689 RepID=A0A9X0QCD8_9BACT|nr:PAS domain S-box protein [Edaphobacter lichenicola]MBB5327749.1 PAS domain S-box-containing protein [Edaphobacter lichenicola]
MNALLVKDEALRIEALNQYEVLNSAPDPILDDLTSLAAQICDTPVAAVSLIGSDRIWLRSRFGIDSLDVSLGSLPCETTILGDTVYEISDARNDPDYAPDGILLEGRPYRFYAGAPLTTPGGVSIGALLVLDRHARTLTPAQSSALSVLSRQVITRLELNGRIRQMDRAARSRQRVESALTVERNFVSAVLDTVGALVAVFDPAGRIVRFNRACENASGYDFPTLVGRYAWDKLIPRQEIPEAIETFERLRSGHFPAAYENQWLNRDGSIRRIAWSATALTDTQGQVAFIIATGIDVTTQRAAEATLRESEARYRQLVEGSLGMVCTHDLRGTLLSINTHGAETLGRSVEEMTGHNLEEFIVPEKKAGMPAYLKKIGETGEAQGLLHLSHSDGEMRVVAYRNKLIVVPGRAPYVLGFGVDISEQVRAEGRLRTLTRQSDSILESVGDGIYGIDLDGKVTVVNSAAAQMLGYKQEEMLGRNMHQLIHHTRADGTLYASADSPIRKSLTNFATVRISNEIFWRKDGTCFPVEYVARPQIDSQSPDTNGLKALGVVVAFTDTTERRALDRMKDEFISTVSHELRTPLTSLRGALGLLAGGALTNRPEKTQQMLEIAISNSDRLVRLVNDILDLERISSGKTELHSTMCSAEDLLRRAAGVQQTRSPRPNIRIFFAAHGVNVWADPDRILQTLNNLISNAIKFSPEGSEIHLTARNLDENEALIEVRDQGRGIPADKLEHIFDRFQQGDASDSRAMGGTGLGLAICRSIVNQHGGRIWATSAPDQGTIFYFTLPTKPSTNLL